MLTTPSEMGYASCIEMDIVTDPNLHHMTPEPPLKQ